MSAILVPVGLGGPDSEVVALACDLLGGKKGQLYIIYAIEVARDQPIDAEIPDKLESGEELLKQMEEIARPFGYNTQADILQSRHAGTAAVQEAHDKDVDAIVFGVNRGSGPSNTMLPNENARYILSNSPCRVILWQGTTDAKPFLTVE
jgi:nucleotide-binding universal stress UspA family protein